MILSHGGSILKISRFNLDKKGFGDEYDRIPVWIF